METEHASVRVGRKRQSSESSEGHQDLPKTKKKKKAAKEKPIPASSSTTSSTSLPPPPTPPTPTPPHTAVPHLDSDATDEVSASVATAEEAGGSKSKGAGGVSGKSRAKSKNYYLKPHNGSWMTHIASLVVHQTVSQAVAQTFDPRQHLHTINWELLSRETISPDSLKMIWFLISKEFPDMPLADIIHNLQPYSDLTIEEFVRDNIKQKYKDQIPKQPLSPFMLFCKSKGPKLKAKHPELNQREMAIKLGKKWQSMGSEKQDKYKQQQVALKKVYDVDLEQFYTEHPEARPPPPSKKSDRKKSGRTQAALAKNAFLTAEERKAMELRALLPKVPASAYLLFCKAKREKLHRKHANLSPREVTKKLAKRWNSIGDEGQLKYKRSYEQNRQVYVQQLEEFYQQHPEAKELLKRNKKKPTPKASAAKAVSAVYTNHTAEEEEEETVVVQKPHVATLPPLPPINEVEEEEEEGQESEGELQMDLGHGNEAGNSSGSDSEDSSGSSNESDDED